MTQYLKGSKRLAVIHRWLQGIDDPNYEVLPTRKEGKYIVKKRVSALDSKPDVTQDSVTQEDVTPIEEHETDNEAESVERDESIEEQQPCKPTTRKPRPIGSKDSIGIHESSYRRSASEAHPTHNKQSPRNNYDPTINLEILEQLKLLGDEIRITRERREQKQLINHVIDKRMRTQPQFIPKSTSIEEEYYSEDEQQQPVQPVQQPIFKSRIRR